MKFRQRHFGDRVDLELRDESFEYIIETSGAKKRFTVDYIDFDPVVMEESEQSNTWWRNVGIAWLVIGAFVTWMRYTGGSSFRISFWFYLGLICLAVFRLGRTTFTHHATDGGGRLVLIKDKKASPILEELSYRRLNRLVDVYGEIDFDADPEREVAKFRWLESQGALSREEVANRIGAIRAAEGDAAEGDAAEPVLDVN